MIVICEAEWERDKIFTDQSTLTIAGLEAWVNDKGDVWEWRLRTAQSDPCLSEEIGSGWVDDEASAKQAAEDAILLACNPKPVVSS